MKITAATTFTGERAGTLFRGGVGYTDRPRALAYFRRAGYTVEPGDTPEGWDLVHSTDPSNRLYMVQADAAEAER